MVVGARNSSAANNSASFQDSETTAAACLTCHPCLPAYVDACYSHSNVRKLLEKSKKDGEREENACIFSILTANFSTFPLPIPLNCSNMYLEEKYLFTQNLKLNELLRET